MTYEELQERINKGTLKTRDGHIVRKLNIVRDLDGNLLYEVFVEGICWCLATVNAITGRADENEKWDEDLIF